MAFEIIGPPPDQLERRVSGGLTQRSRNYGVGREIFLLSVSASAKKDLAPIPLVDHEVEQQSEPFRQKACVVDLEAARDASLADCGSFNPYRSRRAAIGSLD